MEAAHDNGAARCVSAIARIIKNEALHLLLARIGALSIGVNLPIDVGKFVIRVRIKIVGIAGVGTDADWSALIRGRIGFVSVESVDGIGAGFEVAQHVIEGTVLHHQDDDALKGCRQRNLLGTQRLRVSWALEWKILDDFIPYPHKFASKNGRTSVFWFSKRWCSGSG